MGSKPSRYERNTSGLVAHARRRAQETRQRVSDTIDKLDREKQLINFNTVARAAGVTKSYLYNQPDLRERIDAIRTLQGQDRVRLVSLDNRGRTDSSKDILLAAKERRIRELETEIQRLKEENKKLHGKLYEMIG